MHPSGIRVLGDGWHILQSPPGHEGVSQQMSLNGAEWLEIVSGHLGTYDKPSVLTGTGSEKRTGWAAAGAALEL